MLNYFNLLNETVKMTFIKERAQAKPRCIIHKRMVEKILVNLCPSVHSHYTWHKCGVATI